MEWLVALVVGIIQGIFEWLPVSSEGNIALYLTAVEGRSPEFATRYSLFLHAGTAVAAAVYYRADLRGLLAAAPGWLRGLGTNAGFDTEADLSFFVLATLVSGVIGVTAYAALLSVVSELAGGAFVVGVGVLLLLTGGIQYLAEGRLGDRESPTALDAALVGVLQGLAILPGVSRSGTTVSALLLRGYEAPTAFRLSFVLSIPAALGAALLVVLDVGLPAVSVTAAVIALAASAVVGYLTVGALVRVARRAPFWAVCVGLGALAVVGGGLLVV